jgi:hypothetical protein
MLVRWRHEDQRLRVATVAGAATDLVCGWRVIELGEEALVDVLVHADHDPGAVLHGVGVGLGVEASGGGVLGVAIVTLDAKRAGELVHDVHDLVAGEVFGKHLKVDGLGTRTARLVLMARGGFGGRRAGWGLNWGLGRGSYCDGHGEEGGNRGEMGGSKVLRHLGVPLLDRGWMQLH